MTVGLAFDSSLHEERFRSRFTRHKFSLLANCTDRAESMDLIQQLKGRVLAELVATPAYIGGHCFNFELAFCLGDNSELSKELKKTSKHRRCPHCIYHFHGKEAFRVSSLYRERQNNWNTAFQLFERERQKGSTWEEACLIAEQLAYPRGPPIFPLAFRQRMIELGKYDEKTFAQTLESFLVCPDILHNCMGLTESVLEGFVQDGWLNSTKLKERLRKLLRRNFLSEWKGSDLRFLVLNWKKFIIPSQVSSLTVKQSDLMHSFFKVWSQVLWVSYQNHKVQNQTAFQFLFQSRIFQLADLLKQFPKSWKLNNLYVHNVLAHFGNFFHKTDLLLVSCEQGEQAFATLSRFSKTRSNHKIRDLYLNFLIYEHFSQKAAVDNSISNISSTTAKTENMMHEFGRTHVWEDIQINTYSPDFDFWWKWMAKKYPKILSEDIVHGHELFVTLKVSAEINNFLKTN